MRRGALAVLAAVLSGCGGGEEKAPNADPFKQVRQDAERPAVARAAPRWERVATLTGTGSARRSVSIARGVIQWRARWRCARGDFRLTGPEAATLARSGCPRTGVSAPAATSGRLRLDVEATGRWRVAIEQQVDVALREPPLPAMRSAAARVLSAGRFYGIERRGGGSATLYRLGTGRLALRLQGFETSPNSDLFVWLSRAARPRTTRAAFRSPHDSVALLRSTLGDQNYLLPRGTQPTDVRSIVIWCEPVRIAYAAAALRPR